MSGKEVLKDQIPYLIDFSNTGMVGRMPTLLVSVLFFLCSLQLFISGLILDNINNNKELIRNFAENLIPLIAEIKNELED